MSTEQKTVSFITLGCKVNQYESDGMAELLKKAGYKIVPDQTPSDVTVVNTCAVTNIASRKSRQMMHRAKKRNPDTVLVAAGCYIQSMEKELEQLPEVDIFLGNNQKNEIVAFLQEYFAGRGESTHLIDINHSSSYEEFSIGATKEHTRAYVKIQDGCNQFCSYCIIPYVRGRVRSRQMEDILKEAVTLAMDGYEELVLTGIHISSYGVDMTPKRDLLTLLKELHKVNGIKRIRLGSLEPGIITESFVEAISNMPKICPHFHLSLQSGAEATLKRMNRKYTAKQYREKCELLRRYYDDPALTTDVIVGFPGETDEEFEETYAYLKALQLYEIHVFPYSVREGTVAAKMPDQVDGKVKKQRLNRLLALTRQQKCEYEAGFDPNELSVLYEETVEIDGEKYEVGHSPNYIKVGRCLATNELKFL